MHPSLVIRVPESAGPTRKAFEKVIDAAEFRDAHDPEWPELISESGKYATDDAPVHINLYRDELVAGRHGRYTFEFVGENSAAVASVRESFSETLAAHRLHAQK
jgi:hypothetical protein